MHYLLFQLSMAFYVELSQLFVKQLNIMGLSQDLIQTADAKSTPSNFLEPTYLSIAAVSTFYSMGIYS